MRERISDPMARLTALGVTIAWAASMPYMALWLPDERVAVLNAQMSRHVLVTEVLGLMALDVPVVLMQRDVS